MRLSRTIGWIALIALLGAGWVLYSIWGPAVSIYEKKYFYVSESSTPEQIVAQLQQEGVLSSSFWSVVQHGPQVRPSQASLTKQRSALP